MDEHTARVILNVTSSAAAETALREGVQTRLVERSTAQLRKVRAHLEHTARIAGTGWATDPVHDKIAVSADATVSGARLDQLEKALKPLGEAVALTRVAGSYTSASRRGLAQASGTRALATGTGSSATRAPALHGGDAIYNESRDTTCSLGFNVRSNRDPHVYFFVTAGHCGHGNARFAVPDDDETTVGSMSVFRPGVDSQKGDYRIVKYTASGIPPHDVDLYNGRFQTITKAGEARVGQKVTRSGISSEVRSGVVTAVDQTLNGVDYDGHSFEVRGLVKTTACAMPGDSGGPFFSGTTALGLTSAIDKGTGCGTQPGSPRGVTYFQPIGEALKAYDVSLY
ncbi:MULTISPECIES: S1 family peptidase [unclassified Streptomyces]|uniref:S1 family peptidase n=1 Tax=Streptomyces sp. NBC_00060 TaxID=2975636 RepID=A0AAU2GTZ1_9ACTN